MSDELVVARSHLSVLRKRIAMLQQWQPKSIPSAKQLFILGFDTVEYSFPYAVRPGVGIERKATLGGDAAFVATQLLLLNSGGPNKVELYDQTSGGRQLVFSQQQNTLLQGMPVALFANTQAETQAADYSFFRLPAEYLLPRNGTLVLTVTPPPGGIFAGAKLRAAVVGYKVYG